MRALPAVLVLLAAALVACTSGDEGMPTTDTTAGVGASSTPVRDVTEPLLLPPLQPRPPGGASVTPSATPEPPPRESSAVVREEMPVFMVASDGEPPLGWLAAESSVLVVARQDGWFLLDGLGWVRESPAIWLMNSRAELPTSVRPGVTHPPHDDPPATGIEIVDAVVRAFLDGNGTVPTSLVAPVMLGCTARLGEANDPGAPPACPDGVAHGTLVPSLGRSRLQSEGRYELLDLDSPQAELAPPSAEGSWRLFAIVRRLKWSDTVTVSDAIFEDSTGEAIRLEIGVDGVTSTVWGNAGGSSAVELVRHSFTQLEAAYLVAPPIPEPLIPSATAASGANLDFGSNARVITDHLNVRLSPGLSAHVLGQFANGQRIEVIGGNCEPIDSGELWLAVRDAGWVRYDPDWIEFRSEVPELCRWPFVPLAAHPADARMGIERLDGVIDAALCGDIDRLVSLVRFREFPCTEPGYPDSIPCPEGAELGTPVDLFPISVYQTDACCGLSADELPEALGLWFRDPAGPAELLAIVRRPWRDERSVDWIYFQLPDTSIGRGLAVADDGTIVASVGSRDARHFFTDLSGPGAWTLAPATPEALLPPP